MTFWQSVLLVAEIFVFVAYLMVLLHIVADLFRDARLGGLARVVWIVLLIALPVLTALVYLVARGQGMSERQLAAASAARQRTDDYIREVGGWSPSQEVMAAKQLLDSGAITAAEFERLKARALAAA